MTRNRRKQDIPDLQGRATRRAGRVLLPSLAAGLALAALAAAVFGVRTSPASGHGQLSGGPIVTVTAGRPSEFKFTLSKPPKISAGVITFKVANKGKVAHQFTICTTPVPTASSNACSGHGTRLLAPGQSATLTITLGRHGTYEFLSGAPGQAAKGMKGTLVIGPPTASPTTPTVTTTPPVTTTPAPASPGTTPTTPTTPASNGDPTAGAVVWQSAGCSTCHTQAEVRGNVGPGLNSSHGGGPFAGGPLTAQQLTDLIAYLNGASR